MPVTFDDVEAKYNELVFTGGDDLAFRIAVSGALANFTKAEPVWIIVSGSSGGGKTELITSLSSSERTYSVSTISAAGLLPFGADDQNPGLLNAANYKLLIVKDMSTITQQNKDDKNRLYGYIRDVYDGEFVRHSGAGVLQWKGKIGWLGASVPAIETYQDFNQTLGERFIYLRLRTVETDHRMIADTAIRGLNPLGQRRSIIREELRLLAKEFVDTWVYQPTPMSAVLYDHILDCAVAAARVRSQVQRDQYDKSIIMPVEMTEVPTRIAKIFFSIANVALSFGTPDFMVMRMMLRLLCDAIPFAKSKALTLMRDGSEWMNKDLASKVQIADGTMSRHMQDMEYLGIVTKTQTKKWRIDRSIVKDALVEVYG